MCVCVCGRALLAVSGAAPGVSVPTVCAGVCSTVPVWVATLDDIDCKSYCSYSSRVAFLRRDDCKSYCSYFSRVAFLRRFAERRNRTLRRVPYLSPNKNNNSGIFIDGAPLFCWAYRSARAVVVDACLVTQCDQARAAATWSHASLTSVETPGSQSLHRADAVAATCRPDVLRRKACSRRPARRRVCGRTSELKRP